jgi:hypothetical protein
VRLAGLILASIFTGLTGLTAPVALGQSSTGNPFVTPIAATEGVITVNVVEFATIPDISNQQPATSNQ